MPTLDERYVLFFDFLGTSDAAKTWPKEKVDAFVDLLRGLAQSRSSFNLEGGRTADGGYKFIVTPEIDTFSDHVVASYRNTAEDPEFRQTEPLWANIVCRDAIRVASSVAHAAIRTDLLIRGGLSVGELYHSDGVVFGEAMVDAYELESRIAIHPRVAVSERIIQKLRAGRPQEMEPLLQDKDGIWHLDYFRQMLSNAGEPKPVPKERQRQEAHSCLDIINARIAEFSARERDRVKLAKWIWFRAQMQSTISDLDIG